MKRQGSKFRLAGSAVIASLAMLILAGCEAPLNLQGVEQEQSRSIHGFDHFKGVAASARKTVAASDAGVLLVGEPGAATWQRVQLPTKASFLNIVSCPNGRFAAVDSRRTLWVSDIEASDWEPKPVATEESLMGLACDHENRVWLGASFSTLLNSTDFGDNWVSTSQDEDLQFTAIQAKQDGLLIAAGEFGTVMFSQDAGANWERAEPLPNEFYPMGLYFRDRQTGWVSGLSGTIMHTADGGGSWRRQESGTGVPLYAFSALGERLFAVGDNATLLELDGDRWRSAGITDGIASYLIGAVPVGEQQLLLAGGAGTLTTVDLIPDAGRVAGQGGEK